MSISDHDMIGCIYKMKNIKFDGSTRCSRDYRNYNPDICESIFSQIENTKSSNVHYHFLNSR